MIQQEKIKSEKPDILSNQWQKYESNQKLFEKLWCAYYVTDLNDTRTITICSSLFQFAILMNKIDQIKQIARKQQSEKDMELQIKLGEIIKNMLEIIKHQVNIYKKTENWKKNLRTTRLIQEILVRLDNQHQPIKQIAQSVEQLHIELKSQLQKKLRKSLYQKLFILMHSDELKIIYQKLQTLANQIKIPYLEKFVDEIKLKVKADDQQLETIYQRHQRAKQNSQNFLCQFRNISNDNIQSQNQWNIKYSDHQFYGQRRNQLIHQKIWYYLNKKYQWNQQSAIFCQMLKIKNTISKLASFVSQSKRNLNRDKIYPFFGWLDKQHKRIKEYFAAFQISKQKKLKLVTESYYGYLQALQQLMRQYHSSKNQKILIPNSKALNKAFDKFCQDIDKEFKYQVNTQVSGIRYGVILPFLILQDFLQTEQKTKNQEILLNQYCKIIKRYVEKQLNSQTQRQFDPNYNIIEIDLHGYWGGNWKEVKVIDQSTQAIINQCMHKQKKNVVLLYLIGNYKQGHDWQYKDIFHKVRYAVRSQKIKSVDYKPYLRPGWHEDPQFLKTYIGPYFYFNVEIYSPENNKIVHRTPREKKNDGTYTFYIGQGKKD